MNRKLECNLCEKYVRFMSKVCETYVRFMNFKIFKNLFATMELRVMRMSKCWRCCKIFCKGRDSKQECPEGISFVQSGQIERVEVKKNHGLD